MVARYVAALVFGASALGAQTPVSRAEAVGFAMSQGARLGLARADTAVATAALVTARAWQNPTFAASYSKAVPNYHLSLDQPLDLPSQRNARIGSARAARTAAQFRFAFERAAAALDADTTYTRAIAARERSQLSRRNAEASDSLRRMVVARRDAGDASELDVELATVTAGQAANVAIADSLTYLSLVLDLQVVIGLAADRVAITPTDSLTAPPALDVPIDSGLPLRASPLQVAAAEAALESARLATRLQHRSIFSSPSISVGFEKGDPTGGEPGFLPMFGVGLPLPLWNRNRGPIAQAQAEQARALAQLSLAQVQSHAEIARARREVAIATTKVQRDLLLVTAATRVASMSLTAYREGASTLPNVILAQSSARDVLAQYVDDLANAWVAAAKIRVLTLTPTASTP